MSKNINESSDRHAPQESRWDGYTPGSKRDVRPRSVLRHDLLSQSLSGTDEGISINHRTTSHFLRRSGASRRSTGNLTTLMMRSGRPSNERDQEEPSPAHSCRRSRHSDNDTKEASRGGAEGSIPLIRRRSFARLPSNSSLGSGLIRADSTTSCGRGSSLKHSTGQDTGERSTEYRRHRGSSGKDSLPLVTQSDHGTSGTGADLLLRRQLQQLEAETMSGCFSLCSGSRSHHHANFKEDHSHHGPKEGVVCRAQQITTTTKPKQTLLTQSDHGAGRTYCLPRSSPYHHNPNERSASCNKEEPPAAAQLRMELRQLEAELMSGNVRVASSAYGGGEQKVHVTVKLKVQSMDGRDVEEEYYDQQNRHHQSVAPFGRTKTIESVGDLGERGSPRSGSIDPTQPLRRAKSNDDIGPRYPMRRTSMRKFQTKSCAHKCSFTVPKAA